MIAYTAADGLQTIVRTYGLDSSLPYGSLRWRPESRVTPGPGGLQPVRWIAQRLGFRGTSSVAKPR